MMTDLFSSLDGSTSFISWGAPIMLVFLLMNKSWSQSAISIFSMKVSSFASKNSILGSFNLMAYSLMVFLILINLLGLTPLTYSFSSALWFACSLAICLWGFLVISGFIYSTKKSAAHLTPAGAPAALIPFLVLIETVSLLIRPLTLTIRLVANISAGHIVLGLVANVLSSIPSSSTLMLLMVISVGYNMFEVFVSFIQAYIFTLLIGLYSHEHP